jgi:hypothetical protein
MHFDIFIKGDTLNFNRAGQIVFQTKVNSSNAAFLARETIPVEELASLLSSITLPMDLVYWRLCGEDWHWCSLLELKASILGCSIHHLG